MVGISRVFELEVMGDDRRAIIGAGAEMDRPVKIGAFTSGCRTIGLIRDVEMRGGFSPTTASVA
ncbi:MAG TPA: hypothetical protein PK402_00695 [Tepidisphaeraceae bacterium]|nr:hypothetical protein [Tepidisphaeraceae bacterium]